MTSPSPTGALFDLTLTEEQQLMRDTARRFAESQMRERSRDADEAAAPPEGFYARTLELGFQAVQIPEAFEGFGATRSPISNMLLAEDLARGDMSLALGALTPLSFVNSVLDQGSAGQKESYLPRFAGEKFVPATVALMEPRVAFDPAELRTRARVDGGDYVLSGDKTMVPLALDAELMLVVAHLEGEGPAAFVVPQGAEGLDISRERHMGLRPLQLGRVKLQDVRVPKANRLGEGERAFDLQRLVDLSRIGIGALAVGVCDAVLDYVTTYCNERVAFGEPISHRQSVAFIIADMAIELDGMRLLVYRAASRAEQGLDFHREAYLAKLQCAERGMQIGSQGVQLLGGHGFIRDHMVELWYRNLRAIGVLEGCVYV